MINSCNFVAPLTYLWHTVLPSFNNLALEDPAVYLDHESLQCYIHGGKCDARGDGHTSKKMSEDLVQIDLSRFLISHPTKVKASLKGVDTSSADAKLRSNSNEAETAAVHVLYTDNTLLKCPPTPSEADSGVVSNQPVLRHSHILFRYGTLLALHGGRDEYGIVCNRILAFHLISRCWEDVQTLYGGDAPPRMYGHAVAAIHAARGFFLIMGVECNPNGTFIPSRKRPRAEALGACSSGTVMGRPPNAHRSALSIYTLRLEDRLEGWRKVGVSDASTHGPCARLYFSMSIPHSTFTPTYVEGADLTEETPMGRVAYLAGGVIGSTYLVDVWRYDLTTGKWREVVLPQHPACDLPLSASLPGPLPQTRTRPPGGRDRRVKPYGVRLVPLIYRSPKGSTLVKKEDGHGSPDETGVMWTRGMCFVLRAPRREASPSGPSLPLPVLSALDPTDGAGGGPPGGVALTLPTVPLTKCTKLSMALSTFLAVDSEATQWLFSLSRDRKLDAVRVQGLPFPSFQVKR
ncbi:unnamed protein product [Phytomonas sp. EM1]|nr:unnamed protein product [Phytomonas sp. EM1]|eukprot:CCW63697.1 unnamed protein product [Phytomonas sp. isolate EM1]